MLSNDEAFRLSEHPGNVVSACLVLLFSSSPFSFSLSRTGFSAEHPSSLSLQPLLRRRRANFNIVEAVVVLLTSKSFTL